jgi:hypothetical protein
METRIPTWVVLLLLVLFSLWILAQAEGMMADPYVPAVRPETIQRAFVP